jgi:hypothetical protein
MFHEGHGYYWGKSDSGEYTFKCAFCEYLVESPPHRGIGLSSMSAHLLVQHDFWLLPPFEKINNLTDIQRVSFAYWCLLEVWREKGFVKNARKWLDKKNQNIDHAIFPNHVWFHCRSKYPSTNWALDVAEFCVITADDFVASVDMDQDVSVIAWPGRNAEMHFNDLLERVEKGLLAKGIDY